MTGKNLRKLFDYQKFQNNSALASMIAETESRYGQALSDDSLEQVSAAGEASPRRDHFLFPGSYLCLYSCGVSFNFNTHYTSPNSMWCTRVAG